MKERSRNAVPVIEHTLSSYLAVDACLRRTLRRVGAVITENVPICVCCRRVIVRLFLGDLAIAPSYGEGCGEGSTAHSGLGVLDGWIGISVVGRVNLLQ